MPQTSKFLLQNPHLTLAPIDGWEKNDSQGGGCWVTSARACITQTEEIPPPSPDISYFHRRLQVQVIYEPHGSNSGVATFTAKPSNVTVSLKLDGQAKYSYSPELENIIKELNLQESEGRILKPVAETLYFEPTDTSVTATITGEVCLAYTDIMLIESFAD